VRNSTKIWEISQFWAEKCSKCGIPKCILHAMFVLQNFYIKHKFNAWNKSDFAWCHSSFYWDLCMSHLSIIHSLVTLS